MATQKQSGELPAVPGFLPEDMVQAGLADDYDAIVREARWVDWDYDKPDEGNTGLFVRLRMERTDLPPDADPDDKLVTQYWSAGGLDFFRPGMTTKEGELSGKEGVYPKRVGTRAGLANNTNWAQCLRSIVEAQIPRERIAADIRWLEGVHAHWNRLPKDKKSGQLSQPAEPGRTQRNDVLCMTRFIGFVQGSAIPKTNGGAGVPTSAPSAAAGSLDATLATALVGGLTPNTPIKKTALAGLIMRLMKGDKSVNKAVKRVVETEFLETLAEHSVLYDAEEGTVTLIAAE